jgi:hypothetical protein
MLSCAVLAGLAASCGGGGGGGASAIPPPASVTVSGAVTFDYVPVVAGGGLDYAATRPRPARGVTVELVSGGAVLASTVTDAEGRYSFEVAPNTNLSLRARAEMLRSSGPSWDVRVVDNTNEDALYVLSGQAFDVGTTSYTRNLHAASGWDGSTYAGPRSAAPFAILDVIYEGLHFVAGMLPDADFPPLVVHWSPNNVPATAASGVPDTVTGEIGTSYYSAGDGIYLLGAADDDTDEYDRHVIAHEWAHYLEDAFSRADTIGGPHTLGDQLDMRVAFSEGFGNAVAAIITGNTIYRDTAGSRQTGGFAFDVEGPARLGQPNPAPGWFSEESIQELLYDLFDPANGDAIAGSTVVDQVHLGFEPLLAALMGGHRSSPALTSLFTFLNALKALRPADAPLIDAQVQAHRIARVIDDYGSTETNFGCLPSVEPCTPSPDLQSVYTVLTVDGPAVNVCSLDDFSSASTGSTNKLGSRRFLRFDVTSPGMHTIEVRAVAPLNAAADPDIVLHRNGPIASSEGAPSAACSVSAPSECFETLRRALAAGEYVLEVYEWTNTNAHDDPEPAYRPIGRTCFDVRVIRQ